MCVSSRAAASDLIEELLDDKRYNSRARPQADSSAFFQLVPESTRYNSLGFKSGLDLVLGLGIGQGLDQIKSKLNMADLI